MYFSKACQVEPPMNLPLSFFGLIGFPTLIFPMLVAFSVPGLVGFEILGLVGWGVPGLAGWGVPGLAGWGVLGLAGWGVPGLVGLVDPGLVRLTLLGLTGKTVLSPSCTFMTGWDNRWAFGSTVGTSKSTPLTTAFLYDVLLKPLLSIPGLSLSPSVPSPRPPPVEK